jgi:hypothetical protein
MTATQGAAGLLRQQFAGAHNWLEGTMAGVTDDVANWQPAGRANPIGAEYLHHVTGEDFFINGLLKGGAPLLASTHAGQIGVSEAPPPGDWSGWARTAKVDIGAARQYAQAVYAATDAYLAGLQEADLGEVIDVSMIGLGTMPLGAFLTILMANCHNHCGEISCLKGLQGLQGYPM